MKIDRIEYQKNYNITGMQWEKIIAGGTLEEGDNFRDAIMQLRIECDNAAQSKIDALYQQMDVPYSPSILSQPIEKQPEPEEKISPSQQEQNILSEIEAANTKEDLDNLKHVFNHSVKTQGAYKRRKKQLNII